MLFKCMCYLLSPKHCEVTPEHHQTDGGIPFNVNFVLNETAPESERIHGLQRAVALLTTYSRLYDIWYMSGVLTFGPTSIP